MDPDVWVPLLLPLAAWPLARIVPRVPPRAASWLLTAGCLVLAAASTAALTLHVFAGLTLVPAVAHAGHWSPEALHSVESVNVPVSIGCGLLLAAVGGAFACTAVRYSRWSRALNRELDSHSPAAGVIILRGKEPVVFSVPGRGGRVAISGGVLDALGPAERDALLAHERAHLRLGHHRFLIAVTVAAALNPLLRPLCSAARFALERWADEAAAQYIGDRAVVAKAVAKAALAGRVEPGFALAATGGHVPRRVTALLAAPARRLPAALLSATLVLGVVGWSAQTVLDMAADLHHDLETAQDLTTDWSVPDAPGHLFDEQGGLGR